MKVYLVFFWDNAEWVERTWLSYFAGTFESMTDAQQYVEDRCDKDGVNNWPEVVSFDGTAYAPLAEYRHAGYERQEIAPEYRDTLTYEDRVWGNRPVQSFLDWAWRRTESGSIYPKGHRFS